MKNFGEKELWAYPEAAQFFDTPYYLRNTVEREKLRISNLTGIFRGPSEQNPIKHFGEKGVWAYPGTVHFFSGTPYYRRNGKSYGFQIWERGRIQ